tara:strand:+ start:81 stop:416 length:336 start_codon:yes stop_codon:yes gene_type:complete
MPEIEVINEDPLTLSELKEKVQAIEKADPELPVRTKKTLEYLNIFAKLKGKEVDALKEKLTKLDLLRLKDKNIVKIIDMQPEDVESLKTILAGDNAALKQEDFKKIIECVN